MKQDEKPKRKRDNVINIDPDLNEKFEQIRRQMRPTPTRKALAELAISDWLERAGHKAVVAAGEGVIG